MFKLLSYSSTAHVPVKLMCDDRKSIKFFRSNSHPSQPSSSFKEIGVGQRATLKMNASVQWILTSDERLSNDSPDLKRMKPWNGYYMKKNLIDPLRLFVEISNLDHSSKNFACYCLGRTKKLETINSEGKVRTNESLRGTFSHSHSLFLIIICILLYSISVNRQEAIVLPRAKCLNMYQSSFFFFNLDLFPLN